MNMEAIHSGEEQISIWGKSQELQAKPVMKAVVPK